MFDILDPLAVISSFFHLVLFALWASESWGSMRVEDTNIKKNTSNLPPQNPLAAMSSLAPSVVLVDLPVNTSPVKV